MTTLFAGERTPEVAPCDRRRTGYAMRATEARWFSSNEP